MTAPTWLVDQIDRHILYGYGQCSCGEQFTRYGLYSSDHRRHLAEIIATEAAEEIASWSTPSGWITQQAVVFYLQDGTPPRPADLDINHAPSLNQGPA